MSLLKLKPHFVFLVAAIVFGLTNLILTPPSQVPDEPAHFFKAMHIANGNFFPDSSNNHVGGYFPKGALNFVLIFKTSFDENKKRMNLRDLGEAFKIRLDEKSESFTIFPNTARIFPIPYFPQALGLFIGKQLFASPLIWFYFGRLFNLISWITLIFLAIKLMPLQKWTMVILALLPMHINLAASLSADAFTNAISFLCTAIFLQIAFSVSNVKSKHIFWMALIVLLVALSKSVYVMIALIFFLIPKSKFKNPRFYVSSLILVAFIGIVGFLVASLYTSSVYKLVEPGVSYFPNFAESNPPVDHFDQLKFILKNPIDYTSILFNSFRSQWLQMIFTGIGILGWLNVVFPFWYYEFMILAVLFMAIFENSGKPVLSLKSKALILLVAFLSIILVYTISYLTWTPVGQNIIDGLQGRYFIPILPLVFMLFYNQRLNIRHQSAGIFTMLILVVSFVVSTVALCEKYWNWI
jgi:uncharacterized membrane protein